MEIIEIKNTCVYIYKPIFDAAQHQQQPCFMTEIWGARLRTDRSFKAKGLAPVRDVQQKSQDKPSGDGSTHVKFTGNPGCSVDFEWVFFLEFIKSLEEDRTINR